MIFTPATLVELLEIMREHGEKEGFSLVAGATDWQIQRRKKNLRGEEFIVDMTGIDELKKFCVEEDYISIGACCTMTFLSENETLRKFATCLCDAAVSVGSWQIRNRATLGGNVANASIAADTPCALAALDATTESVASLITAFRIPIVHGRVSAFAKLGSRSQVSIARLNLAVSAEKRDGKFANARVFVGTLGNNALRCPEAEEALMRGDLPPLLKGGRGDFFDALSALVDSAIPGRATQPYKHSAIRALGEDVLAKLIARCGE